MGIFDFFRGLSHKDTDYALEMEMKIMTGFAEGAFKVAEVRSILAGETSLRFSDKDDIRLKHLRDGVAKGFKASRRLRKLMEFQEHLENGEIQEEKFESSDAEAFKEDEEEKTK